MICRKHYTILTGEKATETFEEEAGLRGFETDKSKRLHYWFCVWLRLKYNPEIPKMKLNYNNLSDIAERAKRTEPEIRDLFKNEEIRNFVFKYNDYFESLLASDIECRTANDRNQWWGLR